MWRPRIFAASSVVIVLVRCRFASGTGGGSAVSSSDECMRHYTAAELLDLSLAIPSAMIGRLFFSLREPLASDLTLANS